jgi:hypothetical protein
MARIMIARQDAAVTVDGVEVEVTKGVSTADSESRIVQEYPDLWGAFPLEQAAKAKTPRKSAKD